MARTTDGIQVEGTVNGQVSVASGKLNSAIKNLTGSPGVIGKRADIRADLDLTDPANRQAFNEFINNPAGGALQLVNRFVDDSRVGVRLYDASQTDVGIEGSGSIADIEFGLDVGGNYKTADVQSAYYYDRETGSFQPWVECRR